MSDPAATIQSAVQLAQSGQIDQAIASLRRAVQQSPQDARLNNVLGIMLLSSGQAAQGEFFLSRAVTLAPTSAGFLGDYGNAVFVQGKAIQAAEIFRRSIAIDPDYWQAALGLVQALTRAEQPEEAAQVAADAAARKPGLVDAYDMGARALILAGRVDDAVAMARRGLASGPPNPRILATLAVALTYSDSADPVELTDIYRRTGRAMMAGIPAPPHWPNSRDPGRRLRIGYLSSDFRAHSVGYFIEPILAHHDPAAVESVCYFTAPKGDAATDRMRKAAHRWVDAGAMRPQDLTQRIRADQIDILIELSGHSHGNRLPILAHRVAPVQATYLGWPTTTGLPTINWRIVDHTTDPAGSEAHATEKLQCLDGCFLCFQPSPEAPLTAPGPLSRGEPLTFGSFNAAFKIGNKAIEAWTRILEATPGSRLLLKATGLARPPLAAFVRERFESRGISADRLILLDYIAESAGHFGAYSRIDIALDTFPYNGTTTTCEALWMGVPVVTLAGAAHASRVGASLLAAAGLPELVASSEDQYISLATELGHNAPKLAALRTSLREQLRTSPLCDAPAFTRRLEAAYRSMWAEWCAGGGGMM